MGTLSKTATVLDYIEEDESFAYFGTDDEDGRNYLLQMERWIWIDLGQPQMITVEIVPGDELN